MIKKTAQVEDILAAAEELDRDKRDIYYKIPDITNWDTVDNKVSLGGAEFELSNYALKQLLKKLKIPAPYYLACSPDLREKEIREALEEVSKKIEYTFKIKDGKIYGIVPKQYYNCRTLPFIQKVMQALPSDCALNEFSLDLNQLRMRFISKDVEFIENDAMLAGVDMHFSEVGYTPFLMRTALYRKVCSNGLILPEFSTPCFKMPFTRFNEDAFINNIIMIPDRLYRLQQPYAELFESCKTVEIEQPADNEIEGKFKTALNLVLPSKALQSAYNSLIVENFANDQNYTLNGLLNAVTRTARDLESDDKVKLEVSAGAFVSKLQSVKTDYEAHDQEFSLSVPNIKRMFARHA